MAIRFEHVRLISFDLDDTLWPCAPVIRTAEQAAYDWLVQHAPRLTARFSLGDLRDHRLDLAKQQPQIAHDFTELRLRSLALLLDAEGYPAEMAREASDLFRQMRNRVTPYDDVAAALQRLRSRYTLVSVTNGNSQIEQTPLANSFDLSLSAACVGAAKPDPAIFHAASERCGVPLSAFLHVGDDPLRDVEAAARIGIATVWVNRDRRDWPDGMPRADLEVVELTELLAHLPA